MQHLLSVDTEDWFQVGYGARLHGVDDWPRRASHIAPMVDALLALFADKHVHCTFFVVGWLAEAHPGLVRRIHRAGHEVASHSHWHRPVYSLTAAAFREDVRRARAALEDVIGERVHGFRAPAFSIRASEDWALDILAETGHRYDSSLLHVDQPIAEVRPDLLEIPPNAWRWGGRHLPVNGGFVFRALPYGLYRRYVSSLERRGRRLIFYTHTWEAYTDYPRMPLPAVERFVQYFNIHSVGRKLARLLDEFAFTSIERAFPEYGYAQHGPPPAAVDTGSP